MLKVSVSLDTRGLKDDLDKFVDEFTQELTNTLKKNTPIRTGNARRGWSGKHTGNKAVVENKVPYIERLENGYSKQAPKGIINPTLTQLKGKFK